MHEEFMGFVSDETSLGIARSVAEARGWPATSVQQGGLDALADMLENYAPPKILLLDLDGQADDAAAATRAIGLCGPDCQIIFLGSHNDIILYRQFIKQGAVEYLVKPLTEKLLTQALANVNKPKKTQAPEAKEERRSKLIPVIGVRGGVGATTISVNLAWILSSKLNQHIGLVDLDVQYGTTALAIDREPGHGMRAALEHPERLDSLLLSGSMVQLNDKFSILCAEDALDTPVHVTGDSTLGLLKPIRGNFDLVIIDMPRHLLAGQKAVFAEAQMVVLVADLTLASLRDVRRIRAHLKNLRPDLPTMLVINHAGDSAHSTIDQATFEKNLEAKVDVLLPEDIKTSKQAANMGKPFVSVAPDAPVSKALIALARTLSGQKEQVKESKGSGLKGLFGGASAKKS